jgi:hypothetical protein
MKAIFSFFTILTFLLSGCTSVHLIEHNEASYGEINNRLQGKKVQITLTNGENIKAENIEIKDHSIKKHNRRRNSACTDFSAVHIDYKKPNQQLIAEGYHEIYPKYFLDFTHAFCPNLHQNHHRRYCE